MLFTSTTSYCQKPWPPCPLRPTAAQNWTSHDSEFSVAWHTYMSPNTRGTNWPPAPCPAHSSALLITAMPSASFIAQPRSSLSLTTLCSTKGAPTPCYEHIILKPNATPPSAAPNPTLATALSCPKHTTHPPIPDDNPHYDVSSYGHRANIALADTLELKIYNEAMASQDAIEWLTACKEEMWTWKDLDVYDIVPQPKGCKVIGSKWVFHVKQGPNRSIQKYKAWIIAQGFTQVEGIASIQYSPSQLSTTSNFTKWTLRLLTSMLTSRRTFIWSHHPVLRSPKDTSLNSKRVCMA